MKTVDYKELILAMDELEKERGIKKDYLIESLETALMMAYKKNFDSRENAKVTINPESGEVHLYTVKKVVEEVEDPDLEINAEEASKVDKKLAIGDDAYIEIIPKDFGRIAAQTGIDRFKPVFTSSHRTRAAQTDFDQLKPDSNRTRLAQTSPDRLKPVLTRLSRF